MTLPRKQRSAQHIHLLLQFTKPFKIFADLSPEAHLQCCHCLAYSFTESGKVTATQYVFREGDVGSNFYMILRGACAVLVSGVRGDGRTEVKQVTTLRPGESFGELALISHQPRLASIVCREDSHFAILSRDDYSRILAKAHDKLIRSKIDLLTRHSIFKKLSKGALTRLTYFFKLGKYVRKQVVFEAGGPADELYIVKEGEFQLTKAVEVGWVVGLTPRTDKMKHCSIDVTLLGVGELLGSEDVLAHRPYAYTCRCSSTLGEVISISRKDFFRLLGNEETLSYFSSLHAAKEVYRSSRIATATKVEREKRKPPISPAKSSSIDLKPGTFPVKSGKTTVNSVGSVSVFVSPRHSRTSSGVTLPVYLNQSETEASPCKLGSTGKSWSQVFCSKYSIAGRPPTGNKGKSVSVVNFHTFSLKKLRVKRFQGFVQGGGGSSRVLTNLSESLLRVRLTDVSRAERSPISMMGEKE